MSRTVRCHQRLSSLPHMQPSAVRSLCTKPRSPGASPPRPPRPQHAARCALLHFPAREMSDFFYPVMSFRALLAQRNIFLAEDGWEGKGVVFCTPACTSSHPHPPCSAEINSGACDCRRSRCRRDAARARCSPRRTAKQCPPCGNCRGWVAHTLPLK